MDATVPATGLPDTRAHWLNPLRLRAYAIITLALFVVLGGAWVVASRDLVDPAGKPLGYDFITFWSASWLARAGEAAAAFDPVRMAATHRLAVPATDSIFLWHYPPTFFVLVLPLAFVPYLVAYALFVAGTFVPYAAVVRRIAPTRLTLLLLAASPAVFVNAFHGQNGFLTAAAMGAALLALDARPVLAGLAIGFLAYKPHFAALFPVALACRSAWRAFAVAAVAATAFVALSIAVMGWDVAAAFLRNTALVRVVLESGYLPWHKMPTLFAFASLLGAGTALAYGVHALGAVAGLMAVIFVWRREAPLAVRGAALVTASVLVTPYVFDYDLALMALPIAWLAMEGLRGGFRPREREILLAAWTLPLLAVAIADHARVQLAPFVLLAVLWCAVERARDCPVRRRPQPVRAAS